MHDDLIKYHIEQTDERLTKIEAALAELLQKESARKGQILLLSGLISFGATLLVEWYKHP